MSDENESKLSVERIVLIIVSVLLVLAVGYIAVSNLTGGREEPAVDAPAPQDLVQEPTLVAAAVVDTAEPEAQAEVTTSEPAGTDDVTPTPRRLALPATPTPFQVAEDDPRAILDLSSPDGFDYMDADTWFDYDSEGSAAYWMADGALMGRDYQPEEKYVFWSFTNPQSGNTYAEINATNGDCIAKDSVGLVIRVQAEKSPSGYAIEVSCDGSWRFRYHRGPDKPTQDLIEWTASEAINTGPFAVNRLGLWGYQGKFYAFVNGQLVGEFFHGAYYMTYGYFAAYVRASQTFDLTASFDDFAFWHIPFIP
jgi:hypothetical protein